MSKHPLFKDRIEKANRFISRKPTPNKLNWKSFYKLSSNENLLGPSPKAMEAIIAAVDTVNEYDFYDDLYFQDALAEFHGQRIKSGHFITANSGVEILEIICRGLVSEGTECIISSPTFSPYKNIISLQGGKVVDVPLLDPNFELDVDGILNAITDKTGLIFITNPNNPTGTYIPKEKIDRLIAELPDDVIVVYDEVYYDFVDATDFPYAIDYIDAGKNVIALHTFSKIYGLAGMRVGYGFSTPKIAEYLNKVFRPFRIGSLPVVAACAALKDTEHLKRSQKMVWEGKKWYYEKLSAAGITYWPTQGNFILVKCPTSSIDITEKMLAEGVMVRPGDTFDAIGTIRITIGTKEANERCWEVLSQLV